jgi:hypothetical protein
MEGVPGLPLLAPLSLPLNHVICEDPDSIKLLSKLILQTMDTEFILHR